MEFELSADQRALAEAASGLLEGMASIERVRAIVGPGATVTAADGGAADDLAAPLDRELWEAMAEQGWLAVERPEEEGGLGLGMVEVAVLCEQLAASGGAGPLRLERPLPGRARLARSGG